MITTSKMYILHNVIYSFKGVNSFKTFFGYPGVLMLNNTEMYRVMKMARNLRALIMVHAETGEMVKEVCIIHYLSK